MSFRARVRDFQGRVMQTLRANVTAPTQQSDADKIAADKEEVELKIRQAAVLATRCRKAPGVGWFPGDPL